MGLLKRLSALAALLAVLAGLGGCAAYYKAVEESNKAWAFNPRVARIKLTPVDPSKPAQIINGTLEAEIPLDSWQRPMEPDSPGKQVGQVLEKATPLGTAVAVGDAIKSVAGKGSSTSTKDSHDVNNSNNQDRHDSVSGSGAP
ncbi:MAG: hypothetical protein HY910_07435 [Desulfarculus sp.]|nr:hypothetical protein [Desulfarculus sp.]